MPFDLRIKLNQSYYKFRLLAISVDMRQKELTKRKCMCVCARIFEFFVSTKSKQTNKVDRRLSDQMAEILSDITGLHVHIPC